MIPNEYMALVGLLMWSLIMGSIGMWAIQGTKKANREAIRAEQERIRRSEEQLMFEVYGPAGKPKPPTAEPESRSRSAE